LAAIVNIATIPWLILQSAYGLVIERSISPLKVEENLKN